MFKTEEATGSTARDRNSLREAPGTSKPLKLGWRRQGGLREVGERSEVQTEQGHTGLE